MRFGVYPNLGTPDEPMGQVRSEACSPADFAETVCSYRGASLLGGCCGTEPEHIRSLAQALRT
jgi:5-methyltetrahydrofolate--homocysteine methyltransferase